MPAREGGAGPAHRCLIAASLAVATLLLSPVAGFAQTEEKPVNVRGRVIDDTGEGVPGQVVRLLKSRTYIKLGGLKSLDQSVEEIRITTDRLGFFEFDYHADPAFPYYYLRFYDPKTFDSVKYRPPEDRDVSKRLRAGRSVQVSVPLHYQTDWPKVAALLETYPPGSQVGQVVRSLGLPTSRSPEGSGKELWTYNGAGVAYVIEGARVIETRTLPGRSHANPGETGKDEPIPAVREDQQP